MKKIKIVIVSLAVAALAAAAGYGIWCSTLEDNVIWEDVSVNEVCIQGMTIEEANAAILEKFEKDYQDAEITVEIADEEYKTAIFPVLGLDVSEIVEEAYVLGHGKWYTRGLDAYRLKKLSPKEVSVFPTADHPEAVEEAVKETGIEKVNTVKETTVEVTETSLKLKRASQA